ncbi:MAG: dTMP kinase [Clostridiaceae bacterium]|nr:dTMP kinase [Clostridiaceae bacterium]
MKKGIFISIEGMDGAGKSTQINLMKKFLEGQGFTVRLTREPGGTNISEKIREIILDKNNGEMEATTEALLYSASRAQHVKEFIEPALHRGEVVLCDRFEDSSIAYQAGGRALGYEAIKAINHFATGGLEPDLTIFFDISPETSLKRINSSQADRLEQEKLDFHRRVYETYIDLAEKNPLRIRIIKADRNIQEIRQDIEKLLIKLLNEI